jgi:type II secretion system protein G
MTSSKIFFNATNRRHQGFTLIEVLVVIFIIGILVSLILANILGARQRAEDVQRKNDLQQLQKALRLYYNDYQIYPEADTANNKLHSSVLDGSKFQVGETVYMGSLPEEFEYYVDNDSDAFRLVVTLDNASDQDITKSQARCPDDFSIDYGETDYIVCEY